jgi:uncharacterized membrane protein
MIKRGFESIAATWLAGLLVLLPLALTLAVLAWALSLVNRLSGPGSLVGSVFAALGYPFSRNPVPSWRMCSAHWCWSRPSIYRDWPPRQA